MTMPSNSIQSDHHFTTTGPIRKRSETDKASRYFFTVEKAVSDQIKEIAAAMPRKGRGSVKVQARIGRVGWETSIFPDKKSGSYLLPIKASIRKQLDLQEGSVVTVFLDLI